MRKLNILISLIPLRFFKSIWFYRAIRSILGMFFLLAGAGKLTNISKFASIISDYGLFPESLLIPAAAFISLFETIAGFGLIFDLYYCLAAITGMLILFISVLIYGIWLGLDIDCGCLGWESKIFPGGLNLHTAVYRNIMLVVFSIYLYSWRYFQKKKPVRLNTLFRKKYNFKEEN